MAQPAERRDEEAREGQELAAEERIDSGVEAGAEHGAPVERVTFEYLKTIVAAAVEKAETKERSLQEANDLIRTRVAEYGGELTPEERTALGGILAEARARLDALREKGAEATGSPTASEQAAALRPEDRAKLTEELSNLRGELEQRQGKRFGEKADGESAEIRAAIARIEGELAKSTPPPEATTPEPEIVFDKPVVENPVVEKTEPAEGPPTTVVSETSPDAVVAPESAEVHPDVARWRTPSVRELLSIAKVRARHEGDPLQLETALKQVQYVESRNLLADGESRAKLIELVKSLSGDERYQALEGPALDALAAEVGVDRKQIEGIVARQRDALEARARDDVRRETQGGIGKVVKKGVAYVGLGAVLNRFGAGALLAPIRMVEAWTQGRANEQKVQARIGELEQQLATGDLRDAEGIARRFLESIASEIAGTKRDQLEQTTRLEQPLDPRETDGGMLRELMERHARQYLGETHRELSAEQQAAMTRAAGAVFLMDHGQALLEMKAAQREPNAFRKLMSGLDKVLGSKVFRGGETAKERMLTIGVFAAAGAMTRELPFVRRFLFAYTGMKAGELVAAGMTRKKGRYEVLNPVTPDALGGDDVDAMMLDRARAQLLDPDFISSKPAEAQQIREALDRHEARMFMAAENAIEAVAARTTATEQALAKKTKLEQEQQFIRNTARVGGAIAGFFGTEIAEWAMAKFASSPEPAAGTAGEAESAVAAVEAAPPKPEYDPKVLELAQIRRGDGLVHVLSRQMEHNPQQFGYSGDPEDAAAIHRWSRLEAGKIAQELGFHDGRGHTTLGLKMPGRGETAAFILKPDRSIEVIGDPDTYDFQKVHGAVGDTVAQAKDAPSFTARADADAFAREHGQRVVEITRGTGPSAATEYVTVPDGAGATAARVVSSDRGGDSVWENISFQSYGSDPSYADVVRLELRPGAYDELRRSLATAHPDWNESRLNFASNELVLAADRVHREMPVLERVLSGSNAEHMLRQHINVDHIEQSYRTLQERFPGMVQPDRTSHYESLIRRARDAAEHAHGAAPAADVHAHAAGADVAQAAAVETPASSADVAPAAEAPSGRVDAAVPEAPPTGARDLVKEVFSAHQRANWEENINSVPERWWEGVAGKNVWASADGKVTFVVGEARQPSLVSTIAEAQLRRTTGASESALAFLRSVHRHTEGGKTYQIFAIPTENLSS